MAIDSQLQSIVEDVLDPDEKLLWAGRPDAMRVATQTQNIICAVSGLTWTVHATAFMILRNGHDPISNGHDPSVLPFHIIYILIGVGMLSSPMWCYLGGLRTAYVVTDKRVIIWSKTTSLKIKSYNEIDVSHLKVVERSGKKGDLIIAKKPQRFSSGGSQIVDVRLIGIPDVHSVETIMRSSFKKLEQS